MVAISLTIRLTPDGRSFLPRSENSWSNSVERAASKGSLV